MTDLSKFIDFTERYHILGNVAVEHDDNNTDLDAGSSPDAQKTEEQVVYTTDDIEEAKQICRSGGFVPAEGEWITAFGYRDSHRKPEPTQTGGALRKDA